MSAEEEMCLFWFSKESGLGLGVIHEHKQSLQGTLAYQRLKIRYASAPVLLECQRIREKVRKRLKIQAST